MNSKNKTPKVSVVFVTYNGKALLKIALDSLRKSAYKDFETIVVDNASADGTTGMLRKDYKNVKIVQNKSNLGYTGINSAMQSCGGEYIMFLNNDLELAPHAMGSLVEVLDGDKTVALAVPKLVNYYDRKVDSAGTWVSRSFYNGHYRADKVSDDTFEIPYMGIGLIRKSFVKRFGYLFDPDYFIYAEDLDLGLRIRLLGMKTMYVPKSVAYHMHSQTMKNVPDTRKTYLLERNLLSTFYKNLSPWNIALYFPYVYLMRIIVILRDLLRLNFKVAFARIRAITAVFLMMPSIIARRRQIQKLRTADDRAIFVVFSEKHLFSGNKITI